MNTADAWARNALGACLLLGGCRHAPTATPANATSVGAYDDRPRHVSVSPLLHEVPSALCVPSCEPHALCIVAIHTPGEATLAPAHDAPADAGDGGDASATDPNATVLLAPDGGTWERDQIWYESGCVAIAQGCAADSCLCNDHARGDHSTVYCPARTRTEPQCLLGADHRPIQRCWVADGEPDAGS